MLQKDIKVGGRYEAMVSGKLTVVRVDAVRERDTGKRTTTVYDVTNERTGRKTTFRSAAKFRREAKPKLKDNLTGTVKRGTPEAARRFPEGRGNVVEVGGDEPSLLANLAPKPEDEQGLPFEPSPEDMPECPDPEPRTASMATATRHTSTAAGAMPASGSAAKLFAKPPSSGTVAGYVPTEEQAKVIAAASRPGLKCLVIKAGAGAGKTSTLKMLEEVLPGRLQYTAFNKALVEDSRRKFRRARVNTTHSLAFGSAGKRYTHRLPAKGTRRVFGNEIAAMLGIEAQAVLLPSATDERGEDGKPVFDTKVLKAGFLAAQVTGAVRRFCQTADEHLEPKHFKFIDGIDPVDKATGKRKRDNQDAVVRYLMPFAQKMWDDITDVDGKMPFTHDHYVKIWQLGQGQESPVIPSEFILLDEAQDTAPVFLDVLQRQGACVVLVGDENQQIYEWRGAVNAMGQFDADATCTLSQSFRFGQAVADVANSVLATLDEPTDLVMKGLPSIPSVVTFTPRNDHNCLLTRTNAGAVGAVLSAFEAGKRPHLVGGGSDVLAFVKGAQELQEDGSTNHPELGSFTSWKDVQEYVKEDDGEDLKLIVKIIDDFGCEPIIRALSNMPKEEDADLVVSTTHKSKGKEWDRVKLAADFPTANRMTDPDRKLLYVALTRAKHLLDISECPPFLPGETKEGERIKPIEITWTHPQPSIEELEAWVEAKGREARETALATPRTAERVSDGEESSPEPNAPSRAVQGRREAPQEFGWTKWDDRWMVRGPHGFAGQEVEVRTKAGRIETKRLGRVAKDFPEASIYEV